MSTFFLFRKNLVLLRFDGKLSIKLWIDTSWSTMSSKLIVGLIGVWILDWFSEWLIFYVIMFSLSVKFLFATANTFSIELWSAALWSAAPCLLDGLWILDSGESIWKLATSILSSASSSIYYLNLSKWSHLKQKKSFFAAKKVSKHHH